jgi:hypothetical protein
MKRRITVKQLQELTPEQQVKLNRWWSPENGDYYYCINWDFKPYKGLVYLKGTGEKKHDALPFLNIGQMIELLQDNNVDMYAIFNSDGELADGLWQAVKAVL